MSKAGPEAPAEEDGGTLVVWSSLNVFAGPLAADAGLYSAAAPPEQMAPAAARDERRQPAAFSAPPARQQPPAPEEEEGANDYDSDEASEDISALSFPPVQPGSACPACFSLSSLVQPAFRLCPLFSVWT